MSDVSSIYIYNGVDHVPNDVAIVRVDSSVTVIPEGAFREYLKLEEVELSEGLISIGINAFYGCASLKRINLPSTLEEIGNRAFFECKRLDEVSLPVGLQQLGEYAFYCCESLHTIIIPPGITKIQYGGTEDGLIVRRKCFSKESMKVPN